MVGWSGGQVVGLWTSGGVVRRTCGGAVWRTSDWAVRWASVGT